MGNSSNASFTWSVSPSVGSSNASSSAAILYVAPSVISARQTVTLTATSVGDPAQQASANILLLPPEAGTIQVTGSLNGTTHTVAISLKVN